MDPGTLMMNLDMIPDHLLSPIQPHTLPFDTSDCFDVTGNGDAFE
jgi:hypothetical protein